MTLRIGFAGMTHLGVVSSAALASKGALVTGFDPGEERIVALRNGRPPVSEPGLAELIAGSADRLVYTAEVADLAECDLVYVSADVPTDDQGRSDLGPIEDLIGRILPALNQDAVLVILCQVPPGFTRALPVAASRLYYQVETLVFGNAVARALTPERFIVGCADPEKALPTAFAEVLALFDCPVLPMRYESAELAKISINICLAASVTVANTMAEVCESIGAYWNEIAPALKLDRRIGSYSYLAAGLGIAGGNIERDMATVLRLAAAHGTDAGLIEAFVHNSGHRRQWAARVVGDVVLGASRDAVLAVWGLAYKENTHSVKNSPSLATLAALPGLKARVHDPVVRTDGLPLQGAVECDDPLSALTGADALAILTPWPQYRDITVAEVARALPRGAALIDPYGVMEGRRAAALGLAYYTLGMPPILPNTTTANAGGGANAASS